MAMASPWSTVYQLALLNQISERTGHQCANATHMEKLTGCISPQGKLRLDTYLASRMPHASRARLQDGIRSGHVILNGSPQAKVAAGVRAGDIISVALPEPPPMAAIPEVLHPAAPESWTLLNLEFYNHNLFKIVSVISG